MVPPYKHEPFTDFTIEKHQQQFTFALQQVEKSLGQDFPLIIGKERLSTKEKITSLNPAKKTQVVGTVSKANENLAQKSMDIARETFEKWRFWSPEARADILFKAAAIVRRRKHEFSAYLVFEAGKPWKEADADTAEAIDFLEYYGRQMLRLQHGLPVYSRHNEKNTFTYTPLGVGVVISPWNFAFAIMCGMTSAALVTGNTVLLKPASTTPVVAAKFMEVLEEAGLPAGVVNFIPGSGSEIGDFLIEHPLTRFISFTGSRDIGTRIYQKAANVHSKQIWLKRVVAEMGGKDTIIVDDSADLDLAAQSIVQSAFSFSGQKCSACSRVVAHQNVYDQVLEKSIALTKQLTVGDPAKNSFMGPVNDASAFNKISDYIDIGKQEGTLMTGGNGNDQTGYFIEPTIFADVDSKARIMQEEIFGPVVAFCKATDFSHALQIANNTDYGLTGAVISRKRAHLERAKAEFHVGNLYFNRGCTGAIVGYQPFGGFNMSGTDSKAGGPDYLLLLMQAKTITEQF